MIITDFNISNSDGSINYQIHLSSKKVLLRGDSATGKSYLCNLIQQKQMLKIEPTKECPLDKILVINSFNMAVITPSFLDSLDYKLILVDTADYLCDINPSLYYYITEDNKHSYLLMGRKYGLCNINPYYYAFIQEINNVRTFNYSPINY